MKAHVTRTTRTKQRKFKSLVKRPVFSNEESKMYYLETAEGQDKNITDEENEKICEEMPDVDPSLSAGAGI